MRCGKAINLLCYASVKEHAVDKHLIKQTYRAAATLMLLFQVRMQ